MSNSKIKHYNLLLFQKVFNSKACLYVPQKVKWIRWVKVEALFNYKNRTLLKKNNNTSIMLYFRFSNHCTCCFILRTEKIRYLTFNLSAPDNATVWSILANRHSVKEWISSSFFCAGHDKKEKTACVEIQQTPQKQFYWCHRAHRQIWKSIFSFF